MLGCGSKKGKSIMSYCVNCGVQLDRTAKRCPLCNTPVMNPKELIDTKSPTPYPKTKGQVDQIKHTDLAILLFSVLGSTSAACGLINFFVVNQSPWSLYIVGACFMLWVFFIPAVIYTRLPVYVSLFLDGLAVTVYCYLISLNTSSRTWFEGLAVPIISIFTLLIILFAFLIRNISASMLSIAIYLFAEIGIFVICLEYYIRAFLNKNFAVSWSAIVLICCICIDIVLVTIITRSRLREAVRRRLHL